MPGRKRRLLVVDDEAGLQRLVRRQAEAVGFEVCTADTAAAGLQLALSERPDVILLDLGLPDASGIEVVEHLKRDPQTALIPVLVWSGSDVEEGSAKAFGAGAVGYFDKIEIADLMAKLRELLGSARNAD
jgi:two-component system KDP operon response regulator KdpE